MAYLIAAELDKGSTNRKANQRRAGFSIGSEAHPYDMMPIRATRGRRFRFRHGRQRDDHSVPRQLSGTDHTGCAAHA